jgi:hypothetical protein
MSDGTSGRGLLHGVNPHLFISIFLGRPALVNHDVESWMNHPCSDKSRLGKRNNETLYVVVGGCILPATRRGSKSASGDFPDGERMRRSMRIRTKYQLALLCCVFSVEAILRRSYLRTVA